jgi:hypothetical protein
MPAKKPSEEEIPAPAVEESAATQPESRLKVRVLENGLRVAGGVAAKGKILSVKKSDAITLQGLGKVKIIGV